jgi:Na+/H+ antiporter NhaD/arsenite permease-like protein
MEHLTEPGVRTHLLRTLEDCKQIKFTYYTTVVNVTLFVVFVAIVAGVLHFKKKSKRTNEEKNKKNEEDRAYIINRIRSLQIEKISPYKLM